ncbi:MAG: redoxin domain-containing protein [Bacteroidetes bacterium]|nr:redoxin domain-containing protein [Bacteroidota bacterium]MBT3749205.1 redoxin domain-containing protein [Bacteroidota bacterium]MBT4399782.1 redoxin domain-containing protein [Bacteroidota bacterium]MBT4410315.1 redoxin domain-containing protein [Bacteroidota bacterium]MBT5427995.1 redoxin domain-containing protein [Bacteroidota bacterium]
MRNKLFLFAIALSFSLLSCNQAGASAGNDLKDDQKASKISVSQQDKKVADKPIKLTKSEFLTKVMDYETNTETWVYEGDKPCIIDFWADWCGPCKKAAPVLDELAKEYAGEIIIYKVNTDQERELASVFGISGIPAFLFVPMKGKPQMTSGIARTHADTKKMFAGLIDEILLNKPKVN